MRLHPRFSVPFPSRAFRLPAPVIAAASLLSLASPRPAGAAWQANGVPVSPMPTALQEITFRGLAADASGGAYAMWLMQETDPYDYTNRFTLRVQRVDLSGNRPAPWTAGGSSIRSWSDNTGYGTYDTATTGLFEDGAGGAVLATVDFTFMVEYMSLLRLNGITAGGAVSSIPIANSSFGGYAVLMVDADGDGAGGAVMIGLQQTFAQPPAPDPPGALYAQRLSAAGSALWPEAAGAPGVELNTLGQTAAGGVEALCDGAGGGFFAWIDARETGDPDLYVQRLDPQGALAAGWPAGGVAVCGASGIQSDPHLASDGAGGVIVVWRDERSGGPRLFAHVVLAGGTPASGIPADGRALPSTDLDDAFVALAGDGQGGCFVLRSGSGVTHLHRLDSAMQARDGWPGAGVALHVLASGGGRAALVPDGLGGAYVTFRNGFGSTPPQGLYAQHVAPEGGPAPGWAAGGVLLSATGQESAIVRSGSGAIAAWNDTRSAYRGIYAQRLVTDGVVATQLALVSASATERRVSLRWFSADGQALSARLERSDGASGWAFLAEITALGNGVLEYQDADVTPGARYGYRLVWRDGAVTRTGGEVWVVVPRDLSLALEAPSPNPSSGAVTIAATLPDTRAAQLGVFDVSGRRRVDRDLSALGAGRHVVALPEVASLAPGLYLVQLSQAGRVLRTRLARVE